jgi:hypothetical protein
MSPGEKDSLDFMKEVFMDGGKYCHLFILKYPCVLTQIMIEHGLTVHRASQNISLGVTC